MKKLGLVAAAGKSANALRPDVTELSQLQME
jgi:hypothetical protein